MTGRMGSWITSPHRLPWVVLGVTVLSVVALLVSGGLIIQQASLSARTTANEAASQAVQESTAAVQKVGCDLLRLQADPTLPPPETKRGRQAIPLYRAYYRDLGCKPELPAQRPATPAESERKE